MSMVNIYNFHETFGVGKSWLSAQTSNLSKKLRLVDVLHKGRKIITYECPRLIAVLIERLSSSGSGGSPGSNPRPTVQFLCIQNRLICMLGNAFMISSKIWTIPLVRNWILIGSFPKKAKFSLNFLNFLKSVWWLTIDICMWFQKMCLTVIYEHFFLYSVMRQAMFHF